MIRLADERLPLGWGATFVGRAHPNAGLIQNIV